jgi:hypothetical protein
MLALSVVDPGFIGGVMISMLALSLVDRGFILKRSYEDTGSVVCLTTKGRQLERNFEELKPASHVPILGMILNIFDIFVAVFYYEKYTKEAFYLLNYLSEINFD